MEEPPKCLVEHPGFQAVFLNYWVLRAAWQYKQQYGALEYEESDHKKSRHIAFRPWKGHRRKYCKRSVTRVLSRQFYSVRR
ncbi:unnamed protein product [Porites evermanni]|uniref:Uncharacterized protein n=1 Tax=Porites evermanni TaxID=104178 RepID=A0ABN8LH59_9CNID|nr:unnamed protein product [Porites evermanni]